MKRNSGITYTSLKNGKTVSERQSKELSLCRLQCREKISDQRRLLLFKEYWDLGKYSSRVTYIYRRIENSLTQSKTKIHSSKKIQRNNVFKFRIFVDDSTVYVCKKCFLDVYGESESFVRSVQEKMVQKKDLYDQRGKTSTSGNQIPQAKKDDIIAHIKSFPAYESHYTREHSNQMFLAENLNLLKMYNLYTENRQNVASYATYRRLFKKQKLKFKKPSLDTCAKCDEFHISIKYAKSDEIKNQFIHDQNKHQELAKTAYVNKKFDKSDVTKTVLCMDLQKCLPTPYLNSSIAFYKRSLWTFNFTIRNCTTNKTYCLVWEETVSGRGANEIASCVWKFFKMNMDLGKHVVIYSDTCSGQNKNNIVSAMFVLLINQSGINVEIIEQKFLEPGHTHLECDSDHSVIERKKKNNKLEIFHPHDWIQLIKSCGSRSNKFTVIEMENSDFYNFGLLFKTIFQKATKNIDGEKVLWRNMRNISYKKGYFNIIEYKETFGSNAVKINIQKNKKTTIAEVTEYKLNVLNENTIPISMEKKKDLIHLLPLIPHIFHNFYKNLKASERAHNYIYCVDDSEIEHKI